MRSLGSFWNRSRQGDVSERVSRSSLRGIRRTGGTRRRREAEAFVPTLSSLIIWSVIDL